MAAWCKLIWRNLMCWTRIQEISGALCPLWGLISECAPDVWLPFIQSHPCAVSALQGPVLCKIAAIKIASKAFVFIFAENPLSIYCRSQQVAYIYNWQDSEPFTKMNFAFFLHVIQRLSHPERIVIYKKTFTFVFANVIFIWLFCKSC